MPTGPDKGADTVEPVLPAGASGSAGSEVAPERLRRWRARATLRERLELGSQAPCAARPCGAGAERVQARLARLERADEALYRHLRAAVRGGHGVRLFDRWQEARAGADAPCGEGYDALDDLVAGVLRLADPGDDLLPLDADMVFYQPTPARHVLDMLARARVGAADVLVDLGAGLGQVPMLAAICTGARAVGVELQPAYVASAARAARDLHLQGVRFLAQDARVADLSRGTVFFLYTPFRGALLRGVLDALRAEARRRPLRLCTFGPCTERVATESWLTPDGPIRPDRIAVFDSRAGHI